MALHKNYYIYSHIIYKQPFCVVLNVLINKKKIFAF